MYQFFQVVVLTFLTLSISAQAEVAAPVVGTEQNFLDSDRHNQEVSEQKEVPLAPTNVVRPYAEYEFAKYLLFSGYDSFDSYDVKRTIARNLPANTILAIHTAGSYSAESVRSEYSQIVPAAQLQVLQLSGDGGFWTRDSLPIPVYFNNGTSSNNLELVDARYYHGNEYDQEFGQYFHVPVISHQYNYEGGNFAADARGNCFLVNGHGAASIPDNIFTSYYGCHRVVRFPYVAGIGHLDERVKIVSDNIALTDTPEYRAQLESLGFQVKMLPKASRYYETYANALQVNGTVFLPIFSEAQDSAAIQVYTDLGLRVVPIFVDDLPNNGLGSIHCITMTYPAER